MNLPLDHFSVCPSPSDRDLSEVDGDLRAPLGRRPPTDREPTASIRSDPALGPSRVLVDADTILDGRLAIFHRVERWLAVADVHFGYELSQRAAGALFPLWGMASVEARLLALLDDYRPAHLVIVGDFVHDRAARPEALRLLTTLRAHVEVILVAGNHDRRAFTASEMRASWMTERFCFHHGDGATRPTSTLGTRSSDTITRRAS